jgi:hypothetical protein
LILEESQQLFFIENEQGDFDFFGENAEPRDLIEPSVLPEGSREELADLDGDGDADVVLIDASGEIFRFAAAINNGGVFVEQLALTPSAPKGEYVFGGIVPAIDGSDEEDVLLRDVVETPADYNSADAVILESAGDGTFFERRIARPSPDARASGIRDVNGDGFPDLLWTIGFDTQLASLNDGSGGFLPAEPFEHFNLTVFDVDNDGRLDRVRLENAFSLDPVRLIVELQQPDGSFMESQVFGDFPEAEVPGFTLPFRLRHADLNSDGLQDLVISWRFLDRISVMSLTNLGNGEFGRHVGIVTRETLVFPFDFALGDVDADGDTDLAIGGFRGPGFLGPTGEFSGVLYNRSAGDKLSCEGDFNGDGRVGPADLGSLLALWGDEATELYPEADLNRDGVISASDLAMLIAAWGLCD